MSGAPLVLAFTAGLLAVVNPCGFAMLPAYLTFFLLGDDDGDVRIAARVRRALVVALSVALGFGMLFAVVGLVVRHLTARVLEYSPWISVVLGVVLVLVGMAVLAGVQMKVTLRTLGGGGTRSARSMTAYGASYGIVSLGCTLPVFLIYVAGTLTQDSTAAGLMVFVAYVVGFTVLLTALTLALALAQQAFVRGVRRVLPYVQRASGLLLVVAGAYVTYYGWYELHRFGERDAIIERVTGWSAWAQQLVADIGARNVGIGLVLFVAVTVIVALVGGSRRRASPQMAKNQQLDRERAFDVPPGMVGDGRVTSGSCDMPVGSTK